MEIITKLDRVFEATNSCPGCGSILGLKIVLQSLDTLDNVILVTSPGSISSLGKSGLKVSFINTRDPASAARGLVMAKPESKVIVYSGDGFTKSNMPSLFSARENFLYVCYHSSNPQNYDFRLREFVKMIGPRASYAATASVAYYEDFVGKLKKAQQKVGFKFIDLFAPCPIDMNFDPSNTIEIARMATESALWPLYEVEGAAAITKIPPRIEPVQKYFETLRVSVPESSLAALQDYATKNWKSLNEGKLI